MPELPEVESIRRRLIPLIVGRRIEAVTVRRQDVVRSPENPEKLVVGQRIVAIDRLGKQLAIHGVKRHSNVVVCIHLGMSGSIAFRQTGAPVQSRSDSIAKSLHNHDSHTHMILSLGRCASIAFRDPRRFGGVWIYESEQQLWRDRWDRLGPDALKATPSQLLHRFAGTIRSVKACLLDQTVVAGLGNIYVDEILHRSAIHPLTPASHLTAGDAKRVVRHIRKTLERAIEHGGSTIRDHRDPHGHTGTYQDAHRVYGRGGLPCMRCATTLSPIQVCGRTTVYCPRCQPTKIL